MGSDPSAGFFLRLLHFTAQEIGAGRERCLLNYELRYESARDLLKVLAHFRCGGPFLSDSVVLWVVDGASVC